MTESEQAAFGRGAEAMRQACIADVERYIIHYQRADLYWASYALKAAEMSLRALPLPEFQQPGS